MNKEEKYKKAEKVIILQQYMSISHLQRMLRIGYNEAFRITERLKRNGIIKRKENSHEWEVLKLADKSIKRIGTMKILNLYAGIGGNRKLWGNDHEITAVEIDPDIAKIYSEFHPGDKVIIGDAHKYLLNHYSEFDFIWSSPPCPTHSRLAVSSHKGNGIIRYPDMNLYQEIIFLKHYFKGRWVVENVISYYKPLIEPIKLNRHYLWTNFVIHHKDIKDTTRGLMNSLANEPKLYQEILGIDLKNISLPGQNKKRSVLRNCVIPEIGKHILDCAMGAEIKTEELELF